MAQITSVLSIVEPIQNGATAITVGTPISTEGFKTLVLETVAGSATGLTISFEVKAPSGAWYQIKGTNLTTSVSSTTTNALGEIWQFDISGFFGFRANITAITTGTVTAYASLIPM